MILETAQMIVGRELNSGGGGVFASVEGLNCVGQDVDISLSTEPVYGTVAALPADMLVPEGSS
jgi:hypothetical protein